MDEIEKFLRQAAARRRAQQQQAAPRPLRPSAPPIQYVEPEIIEPDILDGENVAEHVAHHLDTSDFNVRASQLGERVGLADDNLEAHLQEKFDHSLGALKDTSQGVADESQKATQATAQTVQAGDIVGMLRAPTSLRQAIILSEVLQRPEYRW